MNATTETPLNTTETLGFSLHHMTAMGADTASGPFRRQDGSEGYFRAVRDDNEVVVSFMTAAPAKLLLAQVRCCADMLNV